MKKFLAVFSLLLCTIVICAQDNLIHIQVSSKANLKDKVILINKSSYTVLQSRLVLSENDSQELIGNSLIIVPGGSVVVADFPRNGLRRLVGKHLILKVKGTKKLLVDQKSTSIGGGVLGTGGAGVVAVGINHSELSADTYNNLDDSEITYSFDVKYYDMHHDLYIEIYDKKEGSDDMLDF